MCVCVYVLNFPLDTCQWNFPDNPPRTYPRKSPTDIPRTLGTSFPSRENSTWTVPLGNSPSPDNLIDIFHTDNLPPRDNPLSENLPWTLRDQLSVTAELLFCSWLTCFNMLYLFMYWFCNLFCCFFCRFTWALYFRKHLRNTGSWNRQKLSNGSNVIHRQLTYLFSNYCYYR